ncbi:hypothetical protein GCM10027446_25010 [Angustibacter peucedani]
MSKTRVWSAGTAVVAVLVVIAAWFLLISPQRSEAASLREQDTQQQAFNDQLKLKTQELKAQFASLPARQAQLAEIKQQMPENPALPSLVRDLSKYSDQAGVTLVSVAPTSPTALASTQSAAPTTVATETAPIQQIQSTVVVSGSYAELTLYLQKLQSQMRRAVMVDNISLTKSAIDGAAKGDLQMSLTTRVFVLDTKAAATAASTATTTTGSAS